MTSAMVKATKAPIALKLMKNHNMRRLKKVGFAITKMNNDFDFLYELTL
jgi:hypothetical protein